VKASNDSGVWNEQGAFLDFSIAPAYYQTLWFALLCIAALLALVWVLYQLRMQELHREFHAALDARVNERTRIARELHDTLLQSFQAVLFFLHVASDQFKTRSNDAHPTLDRAIATAEHAVTEGRDAIQGLRSSTTETNSLAVALRALGEGLARDRAGQPCPALDVQLEGPTRDLHPILRDDVFRIASEALRNCFLHAQASRIDVDIRYSHELFRVCIRDDGKGIDPHIITAKGRDGHWGLHGMQERAKLIGGTLQVRSSAASGTAVELTIPARAAYTTHTPLHSKSPRQ
jgi:signal transduction histidine kinase